MFDYNNSELQKLALRASITLLLLCIFFCLAAVVFPFNIFNSGGLASERTGIAGQDIFLIIFTLTSGHFIIDFISPDQKDPILHQVDRMSAWVIRLIAIRHKALDRLYSHFQSAKALAICTLDICKRLWHHTKPIICCLATIFLFILSTIVTGLDLGFKILTRFSPKAVFWVITEIAQVMFISLYSNLQLLYQCSINLVEQRARFLTHIKNPPPIPAAGATNNVGFQKQPTPTKNNGSAVKTIATPTNLKIAVPRGKTLVELIRESRAADELEARKQIEELKSKELEEAKWKKLDKVNQVTDLAMEIVRQGKTRECIWARD